jgi:hypothetical protein
MPERGRIIIDESSSSSLPRSESSAPLARLVDAAAGAHLPAAGAGPRDCGHFDIRIARDGSWFYRGTPIKRMSLVRLFSTVLRREGHEYWLVTPAERGRITVEDAPFIGVELTREGEGAHQSLSLRTNIDESVTIDAEHRLRVATDAASGEPRPYVEIRNGLEARLARPVFYELVELGCEERVGDTTLYGVWSKGKFFPLGRLDAM